MSTQGVDKRNILRRLLTGDVKPLKTAKKQRPPKFTEEQIEYRRQYLSQRAQVEMTRQDVLNIFDPYNYQPGDEYTKHKDCFYALGDGLFVYMGD